GYPNDPTGCYRLPTEAEWEYAVRAGTETAYFFGNNILKLDTYAVHDRHGTIGPEQVRSKKPNPHGLYDVYGNVNEWVQDGISLSASNDEEANRELPKGKDPVTKGFNYILKGCDYACEKIDFKNHTQWIYPSYSNNSTGFRLVRTL
ncbi:MAG: SUMF1/EgtB/PvdO family nonheme iron enzyme, partial [Bdellovibrionaceae bacterium]|nr:SUMF1/EgtB/PvdO family nonheme iron enzyme [Pseudobdellovibrionaceae bacterium]